MHTSNKAAAPRRYVWQEKGDVTFYDGCLVDSTRSLSAHDAKELSLQWNKLPDILEGQFAVMRINDNSSSIEIITDSLGMEQVYYFRDGKTWFISNNVQLIRNIYKANTIDPLGISMFLCIGWAGSDLTLIKDIKVIPGGQSWKWIHGATEPVKTTYYSPSQLSNNGYGLLTKPDIQQLSDDLTNMCVSLSESYGTLQCPITGGRDSRLLVSLLKNGGINAEYYTSGSPESDDVKIALQIAKALNLPHRLQGETNDEILGNWEELCRRIIYQNDGMVSFWQIADILRQPSTIDHLGINLWGAGGEIARGCYTDPKIFLSKYNTNDMKTFLVNSLIKDDKGLINSNAELLAEKQLHYFIDETINNHFSPLDIPDVFCTFEAFRRWAGSNARKNLSISDSFSPYFTRSFITAAFRLSPLQRYSEPLHYELIKLLAPQIHSLPLTTEPWRSQTQLTILIRRLIKGFNDKIHHNIHSKHKPKKVNWFDLKKHWIREFCLDQSDSELWSYVNKSTFERITSDSTSSTERRIHTKALYNIATLFYYPGSN